MRVPRYIAIILCLCCLFARAYADMTPVRILVGTSEMPLAPSPVHDGTRVLAPLTVLANLGATGAQSDGVVKITSASGQSGAVKVVDVDGKSMLPMDKVMGIIGGEQSWDAKNHTLTLLANLESVEFDNDTLKINCSFPVHAVAKSLNGKLAIDVMGAKIASEAKEVYIGAPAVERARLGQPNSSTARVVLDLSKPTGYELQTKQTAAQLLVKIADDLTPVPAAGTEPAPDTAPVAASVTVTGVSIDKVKDGAFDVIISTSARPHGSSDFSVTPPRIVLGVAKARLGDSCQVTGSSQLVKSELINTSSGVKLTLNLAKPMDYRVQSSESGLTIHLRPLLKSGGSLADKVILIDPGHGGGQKGACAGGAMEKNVNMQIAKDLAAALAKQGAKTILSRDSDVEMGLAERAQMAIDRGADFFIAIHCNSSLVAGGATGIETYYHLQEPSGKTMAYLIHDGVCKYTGMCDRRARSDRDLYSSGAGLGVLRTLSGSGIPGILLECGYINNPSDRAKLLDAAYRAKLVNGIVTGLEAYIEDTAVD